VLREVLNLSPSAIADLVRAKAIIDTNSGG
jgi:hypothetical protein